MSALARVFLFGGVFLSLAGCIAEPDVAQHSDTLDVTSADDESPLRDALAGELWCASCVADGLRARELSHDVRFHMSGRTDTVIVEIDGVVACAGDANGSAAPVEVELDAESSGGEDEGNPDPEPALTGVILPTPASSAVTTPKIEAKGEDQGNPDPEPALDKPLPGPRPTLSASRDL